MFLRKILFNKKYKILRSCCIDGGKTLSITGNVSYGSEPYLITVGKYVTLTDGVKLLTHDGGCRVVRKCVNDPTIDLIGKITIGNNVFIGNNAIILYGVTIGDNVIVGCGAVVASDLESNFVYAGVPAKKICTINEFYSKHENEFLHTKTMSAKEKEAFLKQKFLK